MRTVRQLLLSAAAVCAALALAGCGGAASAPTPAPTATATPTATPAPTATATAIPASPAATSEPAAGDGSGPLIAAAMDRTRAAGSYRLALTMRGTGPAGVGSGAAGGPVPMIDARGEVAGDASRVTLAGVFGALLGADPAAGLEMISAGGASYVRGPAPLLGALEDAWYVLPPDGSSPASSVRPTELVGGVLDAQYDLSGFRAAGETSLDGQACRVYAGDRAATIRAFEQVGQGGLPGPRSFSEVRQAEMTFTVCEDGFVHQLTVDVAGLQPGQSEESGYQLDVRLSGFDEPISVAAPADARELVKP